MPRPFAVPETQPPSTCSAPPPWKLSGEAIVLPLVQLGRGRIHIGAQMWVRYDESPVGPYDEYAVGILKRVGKKLGPTITEMAVTSARSVACGRANWGFPKVERALQYVRRGLRVRFEDSARPGRARFFRLSRFSVPIAAPAWCLQVLEGAAVRVPMKICGRARLCLSGRRVGIAIEGFQFSVLGPQP